MAKELLTTTETAEKLGISVNRVLVLIGEGRLPAVRFGRSWAVREDDLALVAERKPGYPKGRPRKPAEEEKPKGRRKRK